MLSTKEFINFFRKNRKITGIVFWTLMYRVKRIIDIFPRDKELTKRIKNSIIVSDVPGQNIVIISFDYYVTDYYTQQFLYDIIKFICFKFCIKIDFIPVNNLDKAYIPQIVKKFIIQDVNPANFLISDPPILLGRSYFYSYV